MRCVTQEGLALVTNAFGFALEEGKKGNMGGYPKLSLYCRLTHAVRWIQAAFWGLYTFLGC
jgi:hypothetical protein